MKNIVGLLLLTILWTTCKQDDSIKTNDSKKASEKVFRIDELTTNQIDALNKDKVIVLLVGGILEQHGPFLPTFTDGYWNETFADTLALNIAIRTGREVLIFPIIPLGNSGANDIGSKYSFSGTYSVRFETLRSVFMDLGIELGEQGFKNIFIIHGHGAPNHQRALDQASDFFNETYKGQMINLFGYVKFQDDWFKIEKTIEQEREDGVKMHGGMEETSAILYLRPNLVDAKYTSANPFPGDNMRTFIEIAKDKDWPGYFGSVRLASGELGKVAWRKNVKDFSEFAIAIIENKIKADTVQRFGDYLKDSPEDKTLDSLSLLEENRRREIQIDWLKRKKYLN